MEITTRELKDADVIAIKGRLDSAQAPSFAQALQAALRGGRYRIVVDMGGLEYMSSAGFRALGDAQRNSRRHPRGEVILAHVPAPIHEALDVVGFTQSFRIVESVAAALESTGSLPLE
jgi:anti-anti-sigma factor